MSDAINDQASAGWPIQLSEVQTSLLSSLGGGRLKTHRYYDEQMAAWTAGGCLGDSMCLMTSF